MPSLNEVLRKYAEQSSQGLLPAVDEIVQHGHLAEYLHHLAHARGGRTVDEFPVAYRHPNGFIKIRLTSLKDFRWTVRLHIWAERSSDYDIHSHRWNFASRVLFGSLIEDTYALTAEEGEYTRYQCSPSIEGRYTLNHQGKCAVGLIAQNRYHRGASYEREARTLHLASTDVTSRAVTLFIQGPEEQPFTTVIRKPRADINPNTIAPRCATSEVIGFLKEAIEMLADG